MSLWVIEEAMKKSFRLRGLITSFKSSSCPSLRQFTHIVSQKQCPKLTLKIYACPARFFSMDNRDRNALEETTTELSVSHDSHSDEAAASEQKQKFLFMEHLRLCHSPSDVLDLTSKHPLTSRQVSNCLDQMWTSMKKMSEDQRSYEQQLMFAHSGFDNLLQKALTSVNHMNNDDITYSLLSMINLGVPQRSRVVQTFLRACQEELNDFDERNLSVLAFCLERMENSPNVDALKNGLRLLVEANLPGIKNVMTLQVMMRILGKDAPKELKWKLEKKALSMAEQFSLPNAQHMISTMATMRFHSKPLLHMCSQKIAENLHGIPFNRLLKVLQSCRELLYRDRNLFAAISEYVASTLEIWTNKQLLLFLSAFEDLHFCPDALMEAYSEKVIARPDALTLKDLLCVLKVYSSLNWDLKEKKQEFLDALSRSVIAYLPKMSASELLKAVYCFCTMGHFPAVLLQQLLKTNTIEQLLVSKFPKSLERMFQTVDLCLRLDRPPLPHPLAVPASLLRTTPPSGHPVNPGLFRGLQASMESQAHTTLQETVVVEKFYVIDGLVTKSVGNQISVAEDEQSSPAEGSQRIAVLYAPYSAFCFGSSNPRGQLAVKIRHLKILGFTPVLVTEEELQRDSEEEKIEILRKRIFPSDQHLKS